jgi:hypothetical protein
MPKSTLLNSKDAKCSTPSYFIRIELIKPSSKTEEVTVTGSETPTWRIEFTKEMTQDSIKVDY